jgi:hypothetical protein
MWSRVVAVSLLAALVALIASPVAARAENPFGSCPAPPRTQLEVELNPHSPWEEVCAEEATREAAEHVPATLLEVNVRQHHSGAYSHPGRTEIVVKATPSATVTLTANHGIRTLHYRNGVPIEEEGEAEARRAEGFLVKEARAAEGELADEIEGTMIRWSCRHPRETIHYTVTAQGGSGPPLAYTGDFTIPLSARWCAATKQRERREHVATARDEARGRAEEHREATERARREAEALHHELEQWEANCRKLGGTVVWLHVGSTGAVAPVCRGPNGGTIEVPV